MNIYNSKTWMEDLDKTSDSIEDISMLAGKSVLITGATGLICSAVVDILITYNEKILSRVENSDCNSNNGFIQIYIACRSQAKAQERFADYYNKEYMHFVAYDAASSYEELKKSFDEVGMKLDDVDIKPDDKVLKFDYVIHGASNAFPQKIMAEPVETMLSNFQGLYNLLEYVRKTKACLDNSEVTNEFYNEDIDIKSSGSDDIVTKNVAGYNPRVLYVSSSEIYGRMDATRPYLEEEGGFIDILNPRSSYGESKRAAETLCAAYSLEYGLETVIVRPGHIYGPTASPTDNRVSSQFAYDAAAGKDIVMNSPGTQLRSYTHALDCASAMLVVLLKGESAKAYNVSNPNAIITIRQMAEYLTEAAGVQLLSEAATLEQLKSYNAMDCSALDSTKLEGLGWKGLFDAPTGLGNTVKVLQEAYYN